MMKKLINLIIFLHNNIIHLHQMIRIVIIIRTLKIPACNDIHRFFIVS